MIIRSFFRGAWHGLVKVGRGYEWDSDLSRATRFEMSEIAELKRKLGVDASA